MPNDNALKGYFMANKYLHFRSVLKNKQSDLIDINNKSKDERKPVELDQSKNGRLTRIDAMQVQAMSSAVSQRRIVELKRIEAALNRIEEGNFGYCLQCGDKIELDRLELDPAILKCVVCAKESDH
jgi:DnaK suppressor protein